MARGARDLLLLLLLLLAALPVSDSGDLPAGPPGPAEPNAEQPSLADVISHFRSGCAALQQATGASSLAPSEGSARAAESGKRAEALISVCRQLRAQGALEDEGASPMTREHGRILAENSTASTAWLLQPIRFGSPMFYLATAACLLVTFLFEALILQSTIFSRRCKPSGGASGKPAPAKPPAEPQWDRQLAQQFWEKVASAARSGAGSGPAQRGAAVDVVGFTRHVFPASESAGAARVAVRRSGACAGVLEVRARAAESAASAYGAAAGRDFEATEVTLRFGPGERLQSFEVPLIPTREGWNPTRWFRVELLSVVAGSAELGGPTVARWEGKREVQSTRGARVYILQDDVFPAGISADRLESPLWLAYYYTVERIKARGCKYWKTMCGLLYEPVHNVVVTGLVLRAAIDAASNWHRYGDNVYWRILALAGIQMLSTLLLRWGDYAQVVNRGRTGGTRQMHRAQLVSKLMMMEYIDQCKRPGFHWFYAALQNVESVTMDGYWQSFRLAQSLFALALSVLTLLLSKGRVTFSLYGSTLIIIVAPICLAWVLARRRRTAAALLERMRGEEAWVDTFSWLAHAGPGLVSFGPRALARVERRYTQQSKDFITHHQKARDLMNDSVWITRWLTSITYCLALIWGSCRLVRFEKANNDHFLVGDLALLLKIYSEVGKYLATLLRSVVLLQRSAVAISQVSELLNETEHRSLQNHDDLVDPPASMQPAEDRVELQNVTFHVPRTPLGAGPMGPLRMRPGSTMAVPLCRLVRVAGAAEEVRMTFMALLAGVLQPSKGRVLCPESVWVIMLSPLVVGPPGTTVLEELEATDTPEKTAVSLARVLGLDPSMSTARLAPGQLQVLALARALLRDPELLVAVRPLSLVDGPRRPRLQALLRLWQAGGAGRIVRWLGGGGAGEEEEAPLKPRTLVITDEDMETHEAADASRSTDISLDLSAYLVEHAPGTACLSNEGSSSDSGEDSEESGSHTSCALMP